MIVNDVEWIGCVIHQLATISRCAFKDIYKNKDLENVKVLNKACKRLVTHFNHNGKNELLKTTLKR